VVDPIHDPPGKYLAVARAPVGGWDRMSRRLARRLVIAVAAAMVALAGLAAPALAHAVLEFTQPTDGAILAGGPTRVVMGFDEAVELPLGSVAVYDSSGHRVDQGLAYHPSGRASEVATNLPGHLRSGGYVVTWRVISADSHPVHGAFTFQVGPGGSAATTQKEAASLLNAQRGARSVGVLFGIDRAVGYGSVALVVGAGLLLAVAWPDGREELAVRRLLWGSFAVAVLTTAGALLLQGPYGAALPLSAAVKPTVVSSVLATRFGHLYLARAVALIVLVGPLLWILTRRRPPSDVPSWWAPTAVVAAIGVLVTPGLADHAATGQLVPLSVTFDLVHLAAVSVWVGGLALLTILGLRARNGQRVAAEVLPRFSQWALGAVLAIAISGGFAAWREIGSLDNVTTTTYGRLVLAKTVLFTTVVLVATTSRRLTHHSLAIPFLSRRSPPAQPVVPVRADLSLGPGAAAATTRRHGGPGRRRQRLRQAMGAELTLAAAALSLAAILVNVQPARQAANQPFSTEVHAGANVLVDLVLDHTRAGPNTLHFYTLSPAGTRLPVPEVDATVSRAQNGINNLPVNLQLAGPGHFISTGLDLPIPGAWTLRLTVRTDAIDEYYAPPVTLHLH
jgi:copper transport protein